ncbi:Cardiolipin synthase [Roseimaritima multifibrata]|uniref:Cardiolipin synthase n=1 Tax=Roseimaritima multifibrata TaxID=1930274 RepID=A0A517MHL8_9BACT|nr:cardiolipin synthase [Roseimaritima multifibrata]QDS94371.1 Cardiolipin synthase [Roseimaritima multifibrata]
MILVLIHFLFLAAFTVRVLWRDDLAPTSRLAWFIVLMVLPYFGVVAYLLFGEINLGRTIHKRHKEVFAKIHEVGERSLGNCHSNLDDDVEVQYRVPFRAAASVDGFKTTVGNRAELMPDAATARSRLIEDIDSAKTHVHVLYYIWLNDTTGTNVAHALMRAAKRGVKCRAMADGLGSRAMIKSSLWKEMAAAGVKVEVALSFKHLLRTILFSRVDLRNHRKITVIDNRVTYCGSQNCADPEFRVKPKFAPWIDIMARFEGPVVAQNHLLFASDWMLNGQEELLQDLPLDAAPLPGGFAAQVFGDGPTERRGATPQLFSVLMGTAQRELVISTPYFVPDPTVLNALLAAAARGVEVTIVFPKRNDSWIVAAVSRSNYRRMLKTGIKIHEFKGGLLHAKTLTVDGAVTLIGSTNMDVRSFDLNYENDILLRDDQFTKSIRERQQAYIAESEQVTLEDVLAWSPMRRFWNNIVATMSPVL